MRTRSLEHLGFSEPIRLWGAQAPHPKGGNMAIKKVRIDALVSVWDEVWVDEDETIEEAISRFTRHHEDVYFLEVKDFEVLGEIE